MVRPRTRNRQPRPFGLQIPIKTTNSRSTAKPKNGKRCLTTVMLTLRFSPAPLSVVQMLRRAKIQSVCDDFRNPSRLRSFDGARLARLLAPPIPAVADAVKVLTPDHLAAASVEVNPDLVACTAP